MKQTSDSPHVVVFPPLLFGGTLLLGLVLHWRDDPSYPQLLGDRDYASSAAPMQAPDPRVYQIFVDFEAQPGPALDPTPGGR